MRCLRLAGLRRMGSLVPSIAAVAAIVLANPAAARSYQHIRYWHHVRHLHHVRFVQGHRLALRAEPFAPYQNGFRPFVFAPWQQTQWQQTQWQQTQWQESRWQGNQWQGKQWREDQWRESKPGMSGGYSAIGGMAAAQASAAGVPVSLVERVIKRESGGNPRAVSRGNYGLMQIRLGTARAMGYTGSAAGLLDPQTNMTYAVRYLAGAYRAAGGNESRAVALYARGYYDVAKRQGFSPYGAPAPMAANRFGGPSFAMIQPAFQTDDRFVSPARHRRWRYRRHPV
jgi:hypothetical protein